MVRKSMPMLLLWIMIFQFLPFNLPAQTKTFENPPVLFPEALSPRIANYDIDVKLDSKTNMLYGREILTWRNTSQDAINELQLHLYLNAFRNSQSTFMLEKGRRFTGLRDEKDGWGFIEVNRILKLPQPYKPGSQKLLPFFSASQEVSGLDLTSAMEYIQPDTPEHTEDKTVLRVPLPEPLNPGETISLYFDFTAKLPHPPYARTGAYKEFFFVAQWFPKTGVYEEDGWNCHQFHTNSEFYADFGVYNVWMTVPSENRLGATGIRVGEPRDNGDGTATHFYHAEDVHDFAWTTSPEFIEFSGKAQDVEIRALMQPDHEEMGHRHIEAAKVAVEYHQKWYGDYPYPNVTIVDPRRGARAVSGMEYPTFFTVGTRYGLPENVRLLEVTLIHEFGHNYWYGMLASNEFEETWLDEGINTYTDFQIMNDNYGPEGDMIDLFGIKINLIDGRRASYLFVSDIEPTVKNAWEYYSNGSYGVNSYSKPGIILKTLHNYLGADTMRAIMREYLDRWKFKHPTSQDFVDVASDVAGKDLNWFFDQALYTNAVLDYKVGRILSRKITSPKGFDYEYSTTDEHSLSEISSSDNDSITVSAVVSDSVAEDDEQSELYASTVYVRRAGDFKFPVEVEIVFEDGEVVNETWDGQDFWKRFDYIKPARLAFATVDPLNKVTLDINYTNNSKAMSKHYLGENKLAVRWLFWIQFLMDQPDFLNLFTMIGG